MFKSNYFYYKTFFFKSKFESSKRRYHKDILVQYDQKSETTRLICSYLSVYQLKFFFLKCELAITCEFVNQYQRYINRLHIKILLNKPPDGRSSEHGIMGLTKNCQIKLRLHSSGGVVPDMVSDWHVKLIEIMSRLSKCNPNQQGENSFHEPYQNKALSGYP